MSETYTLNDCLKYPYFTLDLASTEPFTWSGAPTHSYRKLWLRRALFIFGALNLVYQNVGMLIYLFMPHESSAETTIAQITETGGIMGLTMVGTSNMLVMFWYADRIAILLEKFQQLFPTERVQRQVKRTTRRLRGVEFPHRIEYFAVKSNKLMKLATTLYMYAFAYYNSLPIVEYLYEWSTPGIVWKYRYQSNTWYPWQNERNSKSFLSFAVAYICQVQSSLTGVAFIMAAEFMLCFFTTQLQIHFDYLANALETIDAAAPNANEDLKYLINYHSQLLSYSKETNAIFNVSFMVNLCTSSIAICLMGFSMVMISLAHAFKYSIGLTAFIVFTFFICYTGKELTETSDKLLHAAFYGNWYDGNLAYRKMILFFIMRCRIPTELRAYKFTVSMPTFTAILRSSYSLFTFFQAMGK
ncbi:putative odorant receptor 69a [Zeugodacus cucurbitae]|uniref:Odorant receptor n=1 Tax=Zeugodacus cucurbitae TaxID=28588 RepID=A0A5H2X603_ZEUCU|nr:putative odorant receptor 69a [Zeugodacus cucurbitae]QKN21154.1 odorant receptor [Zeugodacus cucurbitae]